jgi:hypothetical protein
MADEREFRVQGLTSAACLEQSDEGIGPDVEAVRVRPPEAGIESITRWFAAFVMIMLLSATGGLCWQHRTSIATSVGELKNRRSAVDLILWASGSKKTFNEALADRLKQAQRDSVFPSDQTKPAFKTEFDHVDFQNLSQAWNGKR